MFFNSKIEGATATAAWGTSIGQNKTNGCRINVDTNGVTDFVIGLTYKSKTDTAKFEISGMSKNREILIFSVFSNVFINGAKLSDTSYTIVLARELTPSHYGRLIVSYAPYLGYDGSKNEDAIAKMREILGVSNNGCWFVYDISIRNQSDLYFKAIVVDANNPVTKYPTSQERSKAWNSLIAKQEGEQYVQNSLFSPSLPSLPRQTIYFGAPGTGKSHTIKQLTDGCNVTRTTFHPDSDYSTFVGCYKPTMKPTGVTLASGLKEEVISYQFVPQAFLKAYVQAWQDTDKPCFLIIEEINRGNCAQIFGDLFQLLDRDENHRSEYPVTPDTDVENYLKNALGDQSDGIKDGLVLPPNLYIWATMNTSDQSLFPIDSAFKRRWDWRYVPISDGGKGWKISVGGQNYDWWLFLTKINEIIGSTTNSEDKKLGYYFCKPDDTIINAETFVSKVIFYLWNDVFKDYDSDGGIFSDDQGNRLTFDKFYRVGSNNLPEIATENVVQLLDKLDQGITPDISIKIQ